MTEKMKFTYIMHGVPWSTNQELSPSILKKMRQGGWAALHHGAGTRKTPATWATSWSERARANAGTLRGSKEEPLSSIAQIVTHLQAAE